MYEIAEQVQRWSSEGRAVHVAQVVAVSGFGSSEPGAALAWTDGATPAGALPAGVTPDRLDRSGLGTVAIGADEAAAVGLACAGSVTVLVQPASALPDEAWTRLAAREPLCLVTTIDPSGTTATRVFTPATIAGAFPFGDEVPRLFARGVTTTAVLERDPRLVVTALWPVPALLVVGDGLIADALRGVGALLGWTVQVTNDTTAAVAAAGDLRAADAIVVLSHDRGVDGPALAAALAGDAGYVGALGSRRTQQARRDWLTEHGVDDAAKARIHGPAGLDIDAHTPGEIAVSIAAEILAVRAGSSGGSLRERGGPVHRAGVQAPPPRY
ncbi:MAG: XdhC family protein [Jatrophihabitans sp.]|uniref:XdhC family protein n=1 Tax=Jatrophihabitans sp. TaxID=1932789 RepID=UPI003F7D0A61